MAPAAIFGGLRSNLSSFQFNPGSSQIKPQPQPHHTNLTRPKPFFFLLLHTYQQPVHTTPNPQSLEYILTANIFTDLSLKENHNWRQLRVPSPLAKQVMSTQAAADQQHTSPSQNPPQQYTEDARNDAVKGRDPGLLPPPSAPPSLVNAVKSMTATHDPLAVLRERPREKSFDSPYARSTTSTAPGSPRL